MLWRPRTFASSTPRRRGRRYWRTSCSLVNWCHASIVRDVLWEMTNGMPYVSVSQVSGRSPSWTDTRSRGMMSEISELFHLWNAVVITLTPHWPLISCWRTAFFSVAATLERYVAFFFNQWKQSMMTKCSVMSFILFFSEQSTSRHRAAAGTQHWCVWKLCWGGWCLSCCLVASLFYFIFFLMRVCCCDTLCISRSLYCQFKKARRCHDVHILFHWVYLSEYNAHTHCDFDK